MAPLAQGGWIEEVGEMNKVSPKRQGGEVSDWYKRMF